MKREVVMAGKKKWYAVQKGRVPGIYTTWSECEKQVRGYSGAVYKSFLTRTEAEAYMGLAEEAFTIGEESLIEETGITSGKTIAGENKKQSLQRKVGKSSTGEIGQSLFDYFEGEKVKLEVDRGKRDEISLTESDKLVAYIDGSYNKAKKSVGSGGVIFYKGEKVPFSFGTKQMQYTKYWNVSGELLASLYVMRWAKEHGISQLALYYDYMGIEMWATNRWKQNNPLTQWYRTQMAEYMKYMKVSFHKVAAHTGNQYNEEADQLAKAGTAKITEVDL